MTKTVCGRAARATIALWTAALGLLGSAGTSSAQPFDELLCFALRDPALTEAALTLVENDAERAGVCRVENGAVRACVPGRGPVEHPADPAEGSLVFDRLCYRVACDEAPAEDRSATTRFGTHELVLGETRTICTPAALGDLEALAGRGGADSERTARKAAGNLPDGFELAVCGDFTGDGSLTATDALGVLNFAVGTGECLPCVCDVDMSGLATATDALATLRFVVGSLAELDCPPDANPVTWDGGGDGTSWEDPLNWDIDTRIPDACDDVTIATGANVTVVHGSGDNAAMRVTSAFPLTMDAGSLSVRSTVQVTDTFSFEGGTLADATVLPGVPSFVGGGAAGNLVGPVQFTSSGGTFDGLTVDADMNLSDSSDRITVNNGLTFNGNAQLGSSAQILFTGAGEVFDGTGDVSFVSPTAQGFVNVSSSSDLTIGPDLTIRGTVGQVGGSQSSAVLANEGVINSDQSGTITIRSGGGWSNSGQILASNDGSLNLRDTWSSTGTINITGGGTLKLDGDWDNDGTITMNDSTVELDGEFTLDDLGSFSRSGGTVELQGELDNILALNLSADTGNWLLAGGTVLGGTITAADGARLEFTSTGGTFDGVTMNAPMDLSDSSDRVTVNNGLTLNELAQLGSSAQILFTGAGEMLNGTGEVEFISPTSQGFVNVSASSDLTVGSDITISGTVGQVGGSQSSAVLTNEGVIQSDESGTITVRSGGGWTNDGQILASNGGSVILRDEWLNNGTINITGGGTLNLDGDWDNDGTVTMNDSTVELDGEFTLDDLGSFSRSGGTVELQGELDNILALALNASTGNWILSGGSVLGGGISASEGAVFEFSSTGGTFDAVTMNAPMDLTDSSDRVTINNGFTLNELAQLGASAQILFTGAGQAFNGTGEVEFISPTSQGFVNVSASSDVTIGADITISGTVGQVGGSQSSAQFTNEGTIQSDEAGTITCRSGGGWTNDGQISASNGGSLLLRDDWLNNGTVNIVDGGTLSLDGDWDNDGTISMTDSTVELDGEFTLDDLGTFNRSGGTVELQGVLDNVLALALDSTTGNWILMGGTVTGGGISVSEGAAFEYSSTGGTFDGVTVNAPMNMTDSSDRVTINNGLTLNDTAQLGASAQILFTGAGQTLDGSGEVEFASASSQGFVNVSASSDLTIDSAMTIRGTVGQVGGSQSSAMLTSEGTIDSDAAGTITIRSGGGWSNSGTISASGGDIVARDDWTNTGTLICGAGNTFQFLDPPVLADASTMRIEIGGSSSFGVFEVDGDFARNGTLEIALTGGFDPSIGETFDVITYDSVSGAFDTTTGLDIGGGKAITLTFGATALTAEVVSN